MPDLLRARNGWIVQDEAGVRVYREGSLPEALADILMTCGVQGVTVTDGVDADTGPGVLWADERPLRPQPPSLGRPQ